MSELPPGTLGDAVGVLIYTFICLLTDLVLIWLLWVHRDRAGYVALIAYFVALCVISSIIQQIYQYTYYNDVMWTRYNYIKANYPNAEVIFKSGNSGLSLGLANIRFYCYIIECTYLFTYTLHIALSIYGIWATHRRAEHIYVILSKILPPILTAITIGLEYTPAVQNSWTVYMIVANIQAVASCVFSIVLISMVLWKYVDSKRLWENITTGPRFKGSCVSWKTWISRRLNSKNSGSESEQTPRKWDHVPKSLMDNNWLIMRLSIAILFITGFILATLLVHLPTPAQMAREIMADGPDLSPATARASIVGYIYGVLPGLAIPIVFGLTKAFRHTLYETVVPRCWRPRGRRKRPSWLASDSQINPSPAAAPGSSQNPSSQVTRMMGSHPNISGQDWVTTAHTDMPIDSNEDNSYELSEGTTRPQKAGTAGVKHSERRLGSLDSATSLDSLINWR
ncbi:hypothetical protein GGR51DRAFT_539897 [Nemania sp. FL0031]|nr:hypothetical protein GGR51DRAFT_539897 [Nemania sp. FL0031]